MAQLTDQTRPTAYPFLEPREDRSFCVLDGAFGNDPLILFHATALESLHPIAGHRFNTPDPTGVKGLPSMSFAKRSGGALASAENKRKKIPGTYYIIIVRYETLDRHGIKDNADDIHDYKLDLQPQVIGYCVVPDAIEYVWRDQHVHGGAAAASNTSPSLVAVT